jgi:hypothetical protein
MTYADIGKVVGRDPAGVFRAVKRQCVALGIAVPKAKITKRSGRPGKISPAIAAEFERLYTIGESMKEIGKRYGVSRQYVHQVLRRLKAIDP